MIKLIDILKEIKSSIQYLKPNFKKEWMEAKRYPEFQEMGKQGWIEFAKQGKVIKYSKIINGIKKNWNRNARVFKLIPSYRHLKTSNTLITAKGRIELGLAVTKKKLLKKKIRACNFSILVCNSVFRYCGN